MLAHDSLCFRNCCFHKSITQETLQITQVKLAVGHNRNGPCRVLYVSEGIAKFGDDVQRIRVRFDQKEIALIVHAEKMAVHVQCRAQPIRFRRHCEGFPDVEDSRMHYSKKRFYPDSQELRLCYHGL